MTMTPRQRVEAALRHEQPDRTPVFEYVLLPPLADQLLGRPFCAIDWESLRTADEWEKAVRRLAVDQLDLACRLGHDMMYVLWSPPPPSKAGPAAAPAATADDPVEALKRRNEAAAKAPAGPSQECFRVYSILKQEMARRGADLPILAPTYMHGVWTDVNLMQTMVLAPEVAHEHFVQATRRAMYLIEIFIELGIEMIGVGGDFAGTRLLISPEAYRRFMVPEVRKCSQRVHRAGRWAINASDGDLWPVIEDFLLGCEVDGYLEIDMHAGMDMRKLKAAYGDRVTLMGNLDCGNILSFGTPQKVRRHVIDCLEAGMGHGGHILCASNAITSSVPMKNYLAVLDAYLDFFSLPRFKPGERCGP